MQEEKYWRRFQDVCIGNVNPVGAGAFSARMAALMAGLPYTTSVYTINRFCSSGIQAVANIANAIKGGQINIGIAGGVESMSLFEMGTLGVRKEIMSKGAKTNQDCINCMLPMGVTSENVAEKFNIGRDKQDLLAYESNQKAA